MRPRIHPLVVALVLAGASIATAAPLRPPARRVAPAPPAAAPTVAAAGKVGDVPAGFGITVLTDGTLLISPAGAPARRLLLAARPEPPVTLETRWVTVPQAGKDHRVLHVVVKGKRTLEAAVWWKDRQPPVLIWSGVTGDQDVDGEWSRHLQVGPRHVLVYQQTRALRRCDGEPARMAPLGFHFGSARLAPLTLPLPATDGLVELTAVEAAPAGVRAEPLAPFRFFTASTSFGDGGQAASVSPPSELSDGKPSTAWVEARGGVGTGEFATAEALGPVARVRAVRLVPGHGASPEHLARHNRPRTLYLIFDKLHRYRVTLPQDAGAPGRAPGAAWWVVLPQPVASRCLTVVLGEVYAGSEHQPPKRHGDTALSEVTAFADLDFGDATRRVLDEVARGGLDREQAVALLERLGIPELARLRAALREATLAEREVVLRVLGKLDPVGSVADLVTALPEAEAPLRSTILQAVRQAGAAAAPLLTRLLAEGRLPEAALAEVVAALAEAGGAGAVAWLMGQVGPARPALRAVIIDRLGSVPEATIQAELLARLDDVRLAAAVRADLLQVAFLRVPRASAALREALAQRLAAGWDKDPGFAVRYRQVALAGALGGAAMVGRLAALVGSTADPILRAAAVRSAAQIPLEDARVLVRRATMDRAPDVRVAAVVAWVQGLRDAVGARLVVGLALGDPWPMVREQAVHALGHTCHAEGKAALLKVAATQAEWRLDGIRRAALLSAVRCQVPGTPPVIRELLMRDGDRVLVRSLAARLSGELRLGGTAGYMIRFLDVLAEKVDRVGSRNELLAADLAVALGQLGDRAAVPVLLRAAGVERLPNLQSAALDALGQYCPPAAAALVRAARKSSNRAVSGAAQRTRSRCRFVP